MPRTSLSRARGGLMFRATKIVGYVKLLQAQGIAARRLLANTGIDYRELEHPGYTISLEQYYAAATNLIRLSGNPGIAFSAGNALEPGDLGVVGYALLSSRTMRQALGIWAECSQSLIGSPIRISLSERHRPDWSLSIATPASSTLLRQFCTEDFLVQGMRLFRTLSRNDLALRSLSLAYPEPPHRALYEKLFSCPLRFDAPETVFSVSDPGLDMPIRTSNQELNEVCRDYCQQAIRQLPHARLERGHLHGLFMSTPSGPPKLGDAAARLGYSARTLRRQLQAGGECYRDLKREFRLDLALQYLESGHFAVKEVAHLVGYASPSAFCRAFKLATGQTVRAYLQSDPAQRRSPQTASAIAA